MIGNDIIDLSLAKKESNWQRKGFLNKIFTFKEQLQILNSQNPEIMVWNLWSRKEAAYKIYNRQTQISAFIPWLLECFDLEEKDGSIFGKVVCCNNVYFTKTVITSDSIETIAVTQTSDFDNIKYLDPKETIFKSNGIPNYYDTKTKVLQPLSKSHHGRFQKIIALR